MYYVNEHMTAWLANTCIVKYIKCQNNTCVDLKYLFVCLYSWIIQAMQLELNYMNQEESSLNTLSPSDIKNLLLQVLVKVKPDKDHR